MRMIAAQVSRTLAPGPQAHKSNAAYVDQQGVCNHNEQHVPMIALVAAPTTKPDEEIKRRFVPGVSHC